MIPCYTIYEKIILTDIIKHERLEAVKDKVVFVKADLTSAQACRKLVTKEVGVIYHFASLVSGGAERDFEAGLNANLYAPLNLLEACRKQGRCPKFIFPSSIAAFGGRDLPEEINDYTFQHPQNSYGMAKVIIAQLLNDYSRKGYSDGRGVRLPAIIVQDEDEIFSVDVEEDGSFSFTISSEESTDFRDIMVTPLTAEGEPGPPVNIDLSQDNVVETPR